MNVVGLIGSPTPWSRSAWLLARACQRLQAAGADTSLLALRELPPDALLSANTEVPHLREALAKVRQADIVLVATPIYKASYSGLLKAFLDLLPQDGLRDKTVLAIGTGGSAGHLLAIDYALKPVLHALGARNIVDSVFAVDTQLKVQGNRVSVIDEALLQRLDEAVDSLFTVPSAWRQVHRVRRHARPAADVAFAH